MKTFFVLLIAASLSISLPSFAQNSNNTRLLASNDTILVSIFLKHDQTMNNAQRRDILADAGFNEMFPPEGAEIVDHYVMMGIGQVIVVRIPPNHLRILNRAIELSAWGAYSTEFYITYDLAEARAAE